MTNYTLWDCGRILASCVLYVPFLLCPGYVLGWATDALQFRTRRIEEKLLISAPLSISTVPFFLYMMGRFASMEILWAVIGAVAVTFVGLFIRDFRRQALRGVGARPVIVAAIWVLVAIVSLVDFQWSDRLYPAASSYDYATRTEVTDAISRTGFAPANPFFFPGHAAPLRYHFYWFLVSSMVDKLGGRWVGPGQAMSGGAIWCGLALIALVPLFTWYFRYGDGWRSSRRAWTGIALLGVAGLDILPCLFILATAHTAYITMDLWNEIVAGWLNSLVWAPHHVAGAVACLTGFLVLWTGANRPFPARRNAVLVAGAAFACSAGLSVYVTLVFAATLAVFGVIAVGKRWWNDAFVIAASGAVAALLALPYLVGLAESGAGSGGSQLVAFTVRPFLFVQRILAMFNVSWTVIAAVNALMLPLNYALEFGLLFYVAAVQLRRYARRRETLGRKEWAELTLVGVPLVLCTFLRSSVIQNNDLGWRGLLIPQFVLLLWSIDYVRVALRRKKNTPGTEKKPDGPARLRPWVLAGFWLGLASTVYGFGLHRLYLPAVDRGWITVSYWFFAPDRRIGQRTLALRDNYEWLNRNLAPEALVLFNPGYPDVAYGLYARRQTVASDLHCGTDFGGSLDTCRQMLPALLPLFSGDPGESGVPMESVCSRYGIDAIVVKDLDPVWSDRHSWVWNRTPVFSNSFSRVFACPSGGNRLAETYRSDTGVRTK